MGVGDRVGFADGTGLGVSEGISSEVEDGGRRTVNGVGIHEMAEFPDVAEFGVGF